MADHGGRRHGAGRKPGSATKRTRDIANAAAEGLTPLEFLLSVMRDGTKDDDARRDAAKAAAPYIHPKLSSVEVNANVNMSHEDALAGLDE